MKNIFSLLKLSSQFKYWIILSFVLSFFTIGSGIGLLMTSAYIISKAALQPSISELQVAIVGVRFFGIARGVFRYLERVVSHDITLKLLSNIRVWFYNSIEKLSYSKLIHKKRSDIFHRIVNDVNNLDNLFIRIVFPILTAFLISILMWVVLGIFNPVFSLIFLVIYFFAGIIIPILSLKTTNNLGEKLEKLKSALNNKIVDGIQGLNELLMFGYEDSYFNSLKTLNGEYLKTKKKYRIILSLYESLIGFFMNLTVLLILLYAIPQINNFNLNGVFLAVIVLGVISSFEAILPLPAAFAKYGLTVQSADRVFNVINDMSENDDENYSNKQITDFSIKIKNLNFAYSKKDNFKLNNINLNIKQGSKVAIVGESGSGKSTLLNILLKLWSFDEGKITIGEKDFKHISEKEIFSYFSLLRQKTHIFAESIKENIMLANKNAGDYDFNNVLDIVQLQSLLKNRVGNLNSYLGEHGLLLSGGERQRVAIARTLLKNSPILLLDEFTANLDAQTENIILNKIFEIYKDKTIIWITHKVTCLQKIDEIHLLHNGEILESGSFYDLLKMNGYFKKMYDIQKDFDVIENNVVRI